MLGYSSFYVSCNNSLYNLLHLLLHLRVRFSNAAKNLSAPVFIIMHPLILKQMHQIPYHHQGAFKKRHSHVQMYSISQSLTSRTPFGSASLYLWASINAFIVFGCFYTIYFGFIGHQGIAKWVFVYFSIEWFLSGVLLALAMWSAYDNNKKRCRDKEKMGHFKIAIVLLQTK